MDALLKRHPDIPGSNSTNISEAACGWLRANEATWSPWVAAARAAADGECSESDSDSGLKGLEVALIGLSVFIACGLFWGIRVQIIACKLARKNNEKKAQLKRTETALELQRMSTGGSRDFEGEVDPDFMISYHELEIGQEIGAGGFGSVFRGRFRGSDVAIKMIKAVRLEPTMEDAIDENSIDLGSADGPKRTRAAVSSLRVSSLSFVSDAVSSPSSDASSIEFHRELFRKEMLLLSGLRHPNCVLLMGACIKDKDVVIVTELMRGGSLADALESNSKALEPMRVKLSLLIDVANGLSYLHSANPAILHCDLKPANILLDEDRTSGFLRHAKISDFGLSSGADQSGLVGEGLVFGTVAYGAPEVLASQGASTASDIYSLAIVMWELYTMRRPFGHMPGMATQISHCFDNENTQVVAEDLAKSIRDPAVNLRPPTDTFGFPEEYLQLIKRCWTHAPETRPDIAEIVALLEAMQENESLVATIVRRRQEWEEISADELVLQQLLGEGVAGQVRAALWNGNECAVKIFTNRECSTTDADLLCAPPPDDPWLNRHREQHRLQQGAERVAPAQASERRRILRRRLQRGR